MSNETPINDSDCTDAPVDTLLTRDDVIALMHDRLLDNLDHPELWADMPEFLGYFPGFTDELTRRLIAGEGSRFHLAVLRAVCLALDGEAERSLREIEPLVTANSQSTLVQGAAYFIQGLRDGTESRHDLTDRFCDKPFERIDIVNGSTHLCCRSWLPQSAGNLDVQPWREVWNSPEAQAIRESIHDGSYRYCNKTACPAIAGNELPTKAEVAARSPEWRAIVEEARTVVQTGPATVNLAYDQSCNLSCPSCRTSKYAADAATRAHYDWLQETQILPMLKDSRTAELAGLGDPFASKNFRNLLARLGPEDYPNLRFQLMTNAMLLTRREWERFPALHRRTALRISLDAASGPTHEAIRRGARWPVMLENLEFARELRESGQAFHLALIFVVQTGNYREMGDFVDLGHRYRADAVHFHRMTNWGTFDAAQYAEHAVFMPAHREHEGFLAAMQDPRLRDPMAHLNDLANFVETDGRNR